MIFSILLFAAFILLFIGTVTLALGVALDESKAGGFGFTTLILGVAATAPSFGVWDAHAKDLAAIHSQHEVIAVYEERVDTLEKRLDNFKYPQGVLLNADTPVAAIVMSLSEAEDELATAKHTRAAAIRSIEARRVGPMSGVIWWAGDYK